MIAHIASTMLNILHVSLLQGAEGLMKQEDWLGRVQVAPQIPANSLLMRFPFSVDHYLYTFDSRLSCRCYVPC